MVVGVVRADGRRQWGYFDVSVYDGNSEEKRRTLKKFQLGYLDVRM